MMGHEIRTLVKFGYGHPQSEIMETSSFYTQEHQNNFETAYAFASIKFRNERMRKCERFPNKETW